MPIRYLLSGLFLWLVVACTSGNPEPTFAVVVP